MGGKTETGGCSSLSPSRCCCAAGGKPLPWACIPGVVPFCSCVRSHPVPRACCRRSSSSLEGERSTAAQSTTPGVLGADPTGGLSSFCRRCNVGAQRTRPPSRSGALPMRRRVWPLARFNLAPRRPPHRAVHFLPKLSKLLSSVCCATAERLEKLGADLVYVRLHGALAVHRAEQPGAHCAPPRTCAPAGRRAEWAERQRVSRLSGGSAYIHAP